MDECGEFCDFTERCKSFMWSHSKALCKVYEQEERDRADQEEDFRLCKMKLGRPKTQIQMYTLSSSKGLDQQPTRPRFLELRLRPDPCLIET